MRSTPAIFDVHVYVLISSTCIREAREELQGVEVWSGTYLRHGVRLLDEVISHQKDHHPASYLNAVFYKKYILEYWNKVSFHIYLQLKFIVFK